MKIARVILILLVAILPYLVTCIDAEEYSRVKGIVHVHSNISTGAYSVDTLVEMAQKQNIQVIIFTENALLRWEYGLPPLRKLIKRRVEMDSLFTYGPKRYLKLLQKVNSAHPNMVLLSCAEVAPFYYWTGSPFKKNLTMNRWDEQLLVIGLEKPADYKKLPQISSFYILQYDFKSVYKLWPIIPLFLGLWLLLKTTKSRIMAWILIFASVLFLINNFPFGIPLYDQYHENQGIEPYQNLIDYVNEKGGLTFWSAPEATTFTTINGVKISTPTFTQDLLKANNYTGFASLYEGYREVGGPGGIWDNLLKQYCEGKRAKPIWNIGELSYHSKEASGGKDIDEVQTVFLVPHLSRESVLNALKTGKMYAMWRTKEYELVLENFSITNNEGKAAYMGDKITCEENPNIRFKISCSDNKERNIYAKLIRNGEIIEEFQIIGTEEINFIDDYFQKGQMTYYRLDIQAQYPHKIISNPIFVQFK